ncbi:MAG: hypothetical protein G01um10145_860 [Microgenomates group bacterium Gr01-1014_5]|nr:MAG: hypothetical protein G01um10145_860 [Microgenomates group bacterium Gr01-1014_5]
MSNLPNISPELLAKYQSEIENLHSSATIRRKMSSLGRFLRWGSANGHFPSAAAGVVVVSPSTGETTFTPPIKDVESFVKEAGNQATRKPGNPTTGKAEFWWEKNQGVGKLSTSENQQNGSGNQGVGFSAKAYFKVGLFTLTGLTAVALAFFLLKELPKGNKSVFVALSGFAQGLLGVSEGQNTSDSGGQETSTSGNQDTGTSDTPADGSTDTPTTDTQTSDTLTARILNLIGSDPLIRALGGPLLLNSLGITLKTDTGSDGNITLAPDGEGQVLLRSSTTSKDSFSVTNSNLTSGNLISGLVGHDGSNYNLFSLSSGSEPVERFTVDSHGNTVIGGTVQTGGQLTSPSVVTQQLSVERDISLTGNLLVGGVTRLNSAGRLASITGFYQDSGLFEIDQGSADSARITKYPTAAQGPSTADSVTYKVDESRTTNSAYDTLVLYRTGGTSSAYALDIRDGNLHVADNSTFDGDVTVSGTLTANINSSTLTAGALTVTGNTTMGGDLAINGGDLTSTASTFNFLTSNATTVNLATAATSLSVGASTGTTTVNNALTVTGAFTANGPVSLGDGDDTVTINGTTFTSTETSPITFNIADGIVDAWDLQEGTRNYINVNTTNTSEAVQFGNATTNPSFGFLGTGAVTIAGSAEGTNALVITAGDITATAGDINLNSSTPDIKTSATGTGSLFNANLTTLNIGGALTTLNIADSTTTKTIDIGGVTASGTDTINVATEGTLADVITIGNTNASTTLALTGGDDWNLAATGVLTLSASAAQTTAIVITDTDYTNALSIADNNITGTTYSLIGTAASIDFSEFDVSASTGSVTINDTADAGAFLVEGTNLDINSLDFVAAGTITAASGQGLTLSTTSADIALTTATSGNINLTTGAATGLANILTGNLKVGNGTPTVSLDGEDAYVEGTLEVDGATTLDGALTVAGTLTANGTVAIGDGGDAITLSGTTITLTANTSGNDITLNLTDNNADALDIQEGANNYLNVGTLDAGATMVFGNATTNPTFGFLGTGLITIAGAGAETNSLTLTTGNITLTDGDLTLSGGEISATADDTTGTSFSFTGVNTTGDTLGVTANSLSSGNALNIGVNSTGAASNTQKGLNIALSGTNSTTTQTTYGAHISNTHAGTLSTNVGLYATATGGTTANYAAIFEAGNVGIGDTTPDAFLEVLGITEQLRLTYTDGTVDSRFTVDSSGNLTINQTGTAGYVRIGDSGTPGVATGDDDLYVEGDLEADGTLTVAGAATFASSGSFDSLTVGGGYGATGVTISNAGAISANGALIVDSTSLLTGAVTITGVAEGTASLTQTLGDHVITDGDLTLSGGEISATADDATGTSFSFTGVSTTGDTLGITANSLTSGTALTIASTGTAFNGELLTLSKTGASGSTAFTSDIANVTYSQTFNGGVGLASTGNVLDVSRAIILDNAGNTHTISGALVALSSNGTQTAGTLTDTANVLSLTQSYASATGAVLSFANSGAGVDILGTSSTWQVTKAGAGTFASLSTGAGAISGGAGSFTTLTSSGASTIGTGSSLTNTFGSGASSINTIGAVTTPGALTLHGATTLDNTFTVSGSNLTSLGGNLTVTGTAWTATPTISGLITATSGLTANGTLTANTDVDFVFASTENFTIANTTAGAGDVLGLSFTSANSTDGIDIAFTDTADAAADTISGLNISLTSAADANDTLSAINIAALTGNTALEYAINIGSGWDTDINATTSLEIGIGGTNELTLTTTAFSPSTSDGSALGTGSLMWSDLFLANLSVINFNNGDVTITHATDALTIAGGAVTITGVAEGTASLTQTLGDHVITDGDLTLSGGEISATADDATGTNFSFTTGGLTTGTGLGVSTTASASTAFTGDTLSVSLSQNWTAASSPTNTGNILDLSRALTVGVAGQTVTQSGALAKLSSSGTETTGDIADSSNILLLEQNCGTGVTCSGAVLKITNSGTGADIALKNDETISNSTNGTIAFGADKLTLATAAVGGNLVTANYAGAATQTSALFGLNFDISTNVTVPNTASGNQTGLSLTVKDGGSSATAIGVNLAGTFDRGLDFSSSTISSGGSIIFNDTSSTIDLAAVADNVLEITNSLGTTANDNLITLEIDANTDASDKILLRVVSEVGGVEQTKFSVDSDGDVIAGGTFSAVEINCTDCLDFTDLEDTLDLDAALVLNQTTNTWSQTFTGDTTVGLTYTANSLTTGTAVRLTSSGTITTGGEILDLVGNGITTGNLVTGSTTALTSGSALSLTGPSAATVGITGSFVNLTSDVGASGKVLSSTATIDSTGVGAEAYNLYAATTNSNSTNTNTVNGIYSTLTDAVALGNTNYGIRSVLSNTGANTAGTKKAYGLYSNVTNTSAGIGGSAETYGGYFSVTPDTAGSATAYGLYVTTTAAADTSYGIDIEGAGNFTYDIDLQYDETISNATDGTIAFGVGGSAEVNLTATDLSPAVSDGNALGTTALMWSDLFLANLSVVNFNNGDVTLTHSTDLLTIAGGGVTFDGAVTANTDVDFVFAGNENATITNTTNTLGASGMLDLASTGSTTDTRTLDLSTTFSSTGATTSYGLYNAWTSSAVVTGASVSQTAYGSYNTAAKTGADDATGTYTLYGTYNTASNTGRTAVGTVNTYGGYFSATGDTAGTSSTYGLYSIALSGDTGYGLYIGDGTATTDYGIYQSATTDDNYFAGNVGIGDTTPDALLEINQGDMFFYGNTHGAAAGTDYNAFNNGIAFIDGNSGTGAGNYSSLITGVANGTWGADLQFITRAAAGGAATEKMRIRADGNVGIGDTTPAALFTVGNTDLFQVSSTGGAVTIAGVAEGTASLTQTLGDHVITDGDLTLSGGEIAATSDDATGTNFSFTTGALSTGLGIGIVSTSQAITSGGLLSGTLTSSSATGSFSGDIGLLSTSRTNATALQTLTDSGNILDLGRTTITNHASATTNVTGSILNISNIATQTLGTLTDSANLVVVTQDADATGALLHLVSNRSSTNYSLLIEQTSGGTDTLSLTDAGNLAILGDLTITGGNITSALTLDSTLTVTGTTTLNGIANIGDGGDAITLSGTTITLTANGVGNDITFNLVDNNADALDIQESTNNYINIGTLDAGAAMVFGNAGTNPTYSFSGSGAVTITGSAEGTASLTQTTGDHVITDGDLTLSSGEITATSDDTTGTSFSFSGTNQSGDLMGITANSLTTGTALSLSSTSTAGGASGVSKMIDINRTGTNAQLAHTAYGIYSAVSTGNVTSGTNIAGYFSASNATTANYGLIVENGSVGIGITAPATTLDIDSNSNTQNLRLRGTAGTTEIADMFIRASGALVLGTENTGAALAYVEIDPEDNEYGLILRDSNTGAGTSATYANLYTTDATVDYLNIVVGATTATAGLVIDDDNQVGINTVTPEFPLDVYTATDVYAVAFGDNTSSNSNLRIAGTAGGATGYGLIQMFQGNTTGGNLVLQSAAGSVGIGTTAPDAALEINHATGDSLRLTYNDSNGTAANYTDFSLSSTGALTLTGSAATLGASATAEKTFFTLTPGTITLTAPTAVTSLMETAVITGSTIAASAATTVNNAAGLSISAPIDSTNATLTTSSALRILDITSGAGTLTTQYGIYIDAPTGGATSNIGLYNAGTTTLVGAVTNAGGISGGAGSFTTLAASSTLAVTGDTTLTGDLAVNGGDLTTTATTFNLLNAMTGTLNFGGGVDTVNIGAAGGAATTINVVGAVAFSGSTGVGLSIATGGLTVTAGGATITAGNLGIGVAVNTAISARANSTALLTADQIGFYSDPIFTTAATTKGAGFLSSFRTAGSTTMTDGYGYLVESPAIGALSAITNFYGVYVKNQNSALITNAYGVYIAAQTTAVTTNIGLYNAGTTTLVGATYINDTSNANSTTGLTINQGASDDQIFALKSSDVLHGMTAVVETDTFAAFYKTSAGGGGLEIDSTTDADTEANRPAFLVQATSGVAADTTKTTSGRGVFEIRSGLVSGTGRADVGTNGSLMAVLNNATARFIIDAEGDTWQDGDVSLNGGDVTTAATTATLFNTTATTLSLGGGATTALNLGNGTSSYTAINLGAGAAAVNGINIGGTGANVIAIGNTQTAGSVAIGAAMTGGTITIGGTGLQTGTIALGTGTGAQAINLGTGGTGTKTVILGGLDGNSVTTINSGAGAINIGTAIGKTINIGNIGVTLNVTSGTGSQTYASSVATTATTSSAFVFTGNSLTTGTGSYFNSSSLTTGKLVDINTGSANTFTTGTLLNIASTSTALTSGKFLNISNGSDIFTVTNTDFTTSLPANFTSAGDVGIAYDINFTNPTASYIKSLAPLYIQAGESFASQDLTLKTYNQGSVVIDSSVTTGTGVNMTNIGLTTGTGMLLAHTTSVIAAGGSLARISSTGIDTSTTTGVLLDLSSTASTAGTQFLQTYSGLTTGIGQSIVANALTTGEAFIIPHTTSVIADGGSLARITSSSVDTGGATNGVLLDLASTGSTAGTQFLQTYSALTTGIGQSIVTNALAGGSALSLASSSTAFTGDMIAVTLSGSNAANTGNLLDLTNSGTSNTNTTAYIKHYATGTNNLAFRIDDVSGDTTPFAVDGTGSVGIGTTAPQGNLEIYNNTNAATTPLFSIRSDFNIIGNYGMIRFGDYTQTTAYQKGAIIYESVSGAARGKFHIALENTDGAGTVALTDARLTVLSSGAIGINDVTPDAFLEVLGTTEQLRLTYTDGTVDTRFTVGSGGDLTIDASTDGSGSETLTLTGFTTLTATGVAGSFDSLTVGGGYGSTGVTISNAGAISADGDAIIAGGQTTVGAGGAGAIGVSLGTTSLTAAQSSVLNLQGYGQENEWVGMGMYYSGSAWTAAAISAFQLQHSGSNFQIYGDASLTVGGTYTPTLRFTIAAATGNITSTGDLALNGGDLTTTATTATLFDTTATTLSLGGAATTLLNLGNGTGNYTAINLGSSTGTHTINIAGTGATGIDTINIGTGGTAADTINIGNGATANTIAIGSSSSTTVSITDNNWSVTAAGVATFASCSGCGSSGPWNNITDPTGTQTLAFGDAELTAWTTASDTETFLTMTASALTTGKILDIATSNNTFTTGTLVNIASTSTALTSGKFLNINNGSDIFSVSNTDFTTALPANFTASGDVSIAYDINFTNPTASYIKSSAPLSIEAGETFNSSNLTLKTYNSGLLNVDAAGGSLFTKSAGTVASINRTTSDGTIIDWQRDGASVGVISVASGVLTYGTFTGSHYAWTDETIEKGMLVSLTGNNRSLNNNSNSEILYGITKTPTANDSKILGSYLSILESDQPASNTNPHLVMAAGNGDMWVADYGSNLENGDYLISSGTAGHAMKDDGTYKPAYIIARVAQPVDWNEISETIDDNGTPRKHARISITFEMYKENNLTELFASLGSSVEQLLALTSTITKDLAGRIHIPSLIANLIQTDTLISPVVETTEIKTGGADLTVNLANPASNLQPPTSAFGKLLVKGNLEVTGDATISGTLYADKIKANQIEGLTGTFSELIASQSAVQNLAFERATQTTQSVVERIRGRLEQLEGSVAASAASSQARQQIKDMLTETAQTSPLLSFSPGTWDTAAATDSANLASLDTLGTLDTLATLNLAGDFNVYGSTRLSNTFVYDGAVTIANTATNESLYIP